jgi:hypothetical protein
MPPGLSFKRPLSFFPQQGVKGVGSGTKDALRTRKSGGKPPQSKNAGWAH